MKTNFLASYKYEKKKVKNYQILIKQYLSQAVSKL